MEITTVLTPYQKRLLEEFAKEKDLARRFYLTGGTALAQFYLKHRISLDLDFFTDKDFSLVLVTNFIDKMKVKLNLPKVIFETLFGRKIFYLKKNGEELHVEFTKYPFKRLADFKKVDNLIIDSILDIATNKLFAIFDRNEPKDFVDLYFLLPKFKLKRLVKGVEDKFGFKVEPLTLGAELLKVKKIVAIPKMFKKLTVKEMVLFFENEAKKLENEVFE